MEEQKYNNLQNTAPVQSKLENADIHVPRSAFPYNNIQYFTGLPGAIMPVDIIETLPNEDYTISYDTLVKLRNPLMRQLQTGTRIYLHTFYSSWESLWSGAKNHITKGRSGNMVSEKPKLRTSWTNTDDNKVYTSVTPLSVSNFLGIPSEAYNVNRPLYAYEATELNDETRVNHIPGKINALPFVMYQKLCRSTFFNSNLLQDNKKIYPDDPDDFKLPYNCDYVNVLDYDNPDLGASFSNSKINYVPSASNQNPLFLDSLHFRQFKGDYFTTGLPFPDLIRGDVPTIDMDSVATINWDNVFSNRSGTSGISLHSLLNEDASMIAVDNFNSKIGTVYSAGGASGTAYIQGTGNDIKRAFQNAVVNIAQQKLNLNAFRELEAFTIFKERMARTSGDYNDLIEAQFGYNPKTRDDDPIYIGGTYQDMVYSDVTQVSESTNSSPLGSRAGQGMSASSGYIGKFHSRDYGYIMTVMEIVPDTVYTNGTDRLFTDVSQADIYFPILNNLSPMPILNSELFCDGTNDNDIFAYQERYERFKSRQNKAHGLIALPHDKADFDASSISARRFNSTPTLNNEFMTMSPDNLDFSVYAVSDEPPFDITLHANIDKVSPMPYVTVPGGLSARA